jgi:hypothetical protein
MRVYGQATSSSIGEDISSQVVSRAFNKAGICSGRGFQQLFSQPEYVAFAKILPDLETTSSIESEARLVLSFTGSSTL